MNVVLNMFVGVFCLFVGMHIGQWKFKLCYINKIVIGITANIGVYSPGLDFPRVKPTVSRLQKPLSWCLRNRSLEHPKMQTMFGNAPLYNNQTNIDTGGLCLGWHYCVNITLMSLNFIWPTVLWNSDASSRMNEEKCVFFQVPIARCLEWISGSIFRAVWQIND